MKKQIVIIHGGDTFETYEEYLSFLNEFVIDDLEYFKGIGWKDNLQSDLGDEYDVIVPKMPNKINAKYLEWKIWFEKLIPLLDDRIILIGHSLGGIFLAKYLSENKFPKKTLATFMVAACFDEVDAEYSLGDFRLSSNLTKFSEQGGKIYLYHSKDDDVVRYSDVEKYKAALPEAKIISFEDRGHFGQSHLPELVEMVKGLTAYDPRPENIAKMKETCPICLKHCTQKNKPVLTHLKYSNPEETMIGCRNCNRAEYYYRYPEKVSMMSSFWRWWWKKRIKLVMKYYVEKRTLLKKINEGNTTN